MAFKILYHEDALADLEEIFDWSRERHPETTQQFADDLFEHIELLQSFPYIGAPIIRTSSTQAASPFCALRLLPPGREPRSN
jgi:plasmid stabilization system protein ParE